MTNEPSKDLTNRKDIELLVDLFYDKVKNDGELAPLFLDVNWPTHLPTMYNFWASMMLGEQTYQGNPFQKHKPLPLQPHHFNRWIDLFVSTVNENFRGTNAEEIKRRAIQIANVFQFKMGLMMNPT